MVVTAPSAQSSLAGLPAQGRSASRSASDRRGTIEVLPENDVLDPLARRRPDHAVATSCIGRARPHHGGAHPGRRRFSGQTRTGRYCRARYYHPGLQRFISEDPIGFRGGDVNLYAYVGNQPTTFRDPFGLSQDNYAPDMHKHGAPHVDRYNPSGQNVGRYRPDGTPIEHMGKPSPRIPNSDAAKFAKALTKLKKLMKAAGLLGIVLDILLDADEAGAESDCPAGPGTCGQLLPSAPAETPQLDCLSGRKGVC